MGLRSCAFGAQELCYYYNTISLAQIRASFSPQQLFLFFLPSQVGVVNAIERKVHSQVMFEFSLDSSS